MSDIKPNWEVVEHSWSDTSIMCGDKTICTMSIYDEATEDTQEELEDEVSRHFKLIASAPELLEALKDSLLLIKHICDFNGWDENLYNEIKQAEQVISKATT